MDQQHQREPSGVNAGDFLPTAPLSALRDRAEMLGRLRQFFAARGFLEVDTPLLSADTVVDRHLDPLPVTLFGDPTRPREGRPMWLQTSPEFAMKRLLAGGARAIYQVTHAFRAGESGRFHNPEFTIVEWYRVGDSMEAGIDRLSELCDTLLSRGAAERITYRQAFLDHVGLDPLKASVVELSTAASVRDVSVPPGMPGDDRDPWLNLLLAACVEPNLGRDQPTILYHYPASQAALARVVAEDSQAVAERFELYVDGLELANGYHELLDAAVLRERSSQANQQRLADGKYPLPEANRLEVAMQHGLPPCAGVALGFDRFVMLATGADSIADVITFPIDRA